MPGRRPLLAALLGALGLLPASAALAQNGLSAVGTATATATFESVGVILPFTGDDDHDASCRISYRVAGDSAWKPGLDLWVDHRTVRRTSREFRGSLVHLRPGTAYEIRLEYSDPDGGTGTRDATVTTWSDPFPEGTIVPVSSSNSTLYITQGGTASAYRVYQPAPGQTATIDVQNNQVNCVKITASYVILRGLALVGSQQNCVQIGVGMHDVVIDGNDISNWGPSGIGRLGSWDYGRASGVMADDNSYRIVVQNNVIHNPRGGSNSWESGSNAWQTGDHPMGPQAISFRYSAGNNVIRNNRCYSAGADHYFNDVVGGGPNGEAGNLQADSDVYGNVISHSYDDGFEIEGYNINVRIWGNVAFKTMKAIATANIGYNTTAGTDSSLGPHYIWRNLIFDATTPYRSATKIRGYGGYYFLHNTIMQTGEGVPIILEGPSVTGSLDPKAVQKIGIIKNNIMVASQPLSNTSNADVLARWFFDHNLYQQARTGLPLHASWEQHGVFSTVPVYDLVGDYTYYLAAGQPGIDQGEPIANFNDGFTGSAPDIGAFERGAWPPPTEPACTEGVARPCGRGACAGEETCTGGTWSACDGASPVAEVCANGSDDDCDGIDDAAEAVCRQDLSAAHASGAVAVDGETGEFAAAPALQFSDSAKSDNRVTARALWDAQNLYFAFEVLDANVTTISAARDGEIWTEDGIEIFLDVAHGGGTTLQVDDYHFIVAADAVLWDGRGTGSAGNFGDAAWNGAAITAARPIGGGYSLELAVPWSDLGVTAAAGTRIGMLLVNNDYDGTTRGIYSHNGSTPWNVPDQWGDLVLAAGACPASCDDGDACTSDACDPAAWTCTHTRRPGCGEDAGSTSPAPDAGWVSQSPDAGSVEQSPDAGSPAAPDAPEPGYCGCSAPGVPTVLGGFFVALAFVRAFARRRG